MLFITQGKTNWKYILIVIILAIVVGGGILIYQYRPIPNLPQMNKKPSIVTKTGKVYVFGNEPFTELGLEVEGEKSYCISGILKDQLHLKNNILTVEGNIDNKYLCPSGGETINVTSYIYHQPIEGNVEVIIKVVSYTDPSLEKQLYDEANRILYVPSTTSFECLKMSYDLEGDGAEIYKEHYPFNGSSEIQCDTTWTQEGLKYFVTAEIKENAGIADSLEIKISNSGLKLELDGAYINNVCSLPYFQKIDEFLVKNTKLEDKELKEAEKFAEIPHIDLRDSNENIMSVYWDNFFDFNADGIVDMNFNFNPGYDSSIAIPLIYSKTAHRDKVKYVTIHSGEGIDYKLDGLYVSIDRTGDVIISRRPPYVETLTYYNKGDCERYYLLDIEKQYGIPCDTDWECRTGHTSHSGLCINPPNGLCVYPIYCTYQDAKNLTDFSEENYCIGSCKYNKPIRCNSLTGITDQEINKSKLLEYYNLGILTGTKE